MAISLFPTTGYTLTLSTWNIEWLSSTPSQKIPQSRRSAQDFQALSEFYTTLSSDILAFQEVDDIEAIQKVVGSGYHIYLSDRALPSNQRLQFSELNQYTGFAVRDTLQVTDRPDFPLTEGQRLRFASSLQVIHKGQIIHLLSVHLKAGCSGRYINNHSCRTLAQQGRALNHWLTQVEQRGESYIILGDFNHNLAFRGDWLWTTITEGLASSPRLTTKETQAVCKVKSRKNPDKTHRFRSLIDHIIVSPDVGSTTAIQNPMPTEQVLGYQMSDHCPVTIELN
ncbi:endonuclease/exonuclease/phosphatase family protein [Vibrio hangzhouensis]|uniref:endonuclease/exonuclease/phosphatase family protein n=1 Tax=Vibrio hangzhouensis TaxID=462991 RepID=UPI0028F41564|nr:endonuclease/exonuclease/phosphatase family protein [Vibrio hangzhouensis]